MDTTLSQTVLTDEKAHQLAVMMSSGMPPEEAMPYFLPEMEPADRMATLRKWLSSPKLRRAIKHLQGKDWSEMTLEERISTSIDKHYTEVAYFLYTHNYATLTGAEKAKADTCRSVLEAKLAGLAGKMDALSNFWADVASGRIKLQAAQAPPLAALPAPPPFKGGSES